MACKGKCTSSLVGTMDIGRGGRFNFINGFRWCGACELFFNIPNLMCPCCNQRLRGTPRNNRGRAAKRERGLVNTVS